jgi:Transcriptional regulators
MPLKILKKGRREDALLKEVRKKRAYEDIVLQIKGLIEKGRLKQGDQLPNEKDLSETFKVS